MSDESAQPWLRIDSDVANRRFAALLREVVEESNSYEAAAGMPRDQASPTPTAEHPQTPGEIPGYRILGRLGEGGAGVVWRAEQIRTRRAVALKLIHAGHFASVRARERFDREIELTAQLEHPNIARLYDSGAHRDVQFCAMELIDGLPLDQYVQQNRSSPRQTLTLMRLVCAGVSYAHQRGIIHRDLKPSNILVTRDGQPRVVDFGLAKAMREVASGGDVMVSLNGEVNGTPAFMSPEQAGGKADSIDTRSDVYSLGVILYRLITGKSPHELSGSLVEILRRVSEVDPVRPRCACPGLDADLDALLLKALARRPDDRYATVAALAADLDNYLDGEPLVARPPTLAYFVGKRVRKHWPQVLAGGVALVLLLAVGVYAAARIRRERDAAVIDRRRADEQGALARAGEHRAQMELAQSQLARGDASFAANRHGDARAAYEAAWSSFDRLGEATLAAQVGCWDTDRTAIPPSWTIHAHAPGQVTRGEMTHVAWFADGRRALSTGSDGWVRIWDVAEGRSIRAIGPFVGGIYSMALSPDQQVILLGLNRGDVVVVDLGSGKERCRLRGHSGVVYAVAWLPGAVDDGGLGAISSGADETIRVWDPMSGAETDRLDDGDTAASRCIVVNRAGDRALIGGEDGAVALWDMNSRELLWKLKRHPLSVLSLALAPDETTFLSSSADGYVLWHNMSDGAARESLGTRNSLIGHAGWVSCAVFGVFAADAPAFVSEAMGPIAISCGEDRVVRLWDVLNVANPLPMLWGNDSWAIDVAIAPGGCRILTSASDGTLRLWELTGHSTVLVRHIRIGQLQDQVMTLALAAANRTAITGSGDGLRLFDVESGAPLRAWKTGGGTVRAIACLPDGSAALVVSNNNAVVWDLAAAQRISTLRQVFSSERIQLTAGALSADGQLAAVGTTDGHVTVFDLGRSGHANLTWVAHEGWVNRLHFARSAAGGAAQLVSAGADGRVVMWDAGTGKVSRLFGALRGHAEALAISPDSRWIAAGAVEQGIQLWDLRAGVLVGEAPSYTLATKDLRFTDDGRWLLSGASDGTIRLWGVDDSGLREAHMFKDYMPRVNAPWGVRELDWSADGHIAISAGVDGTARTFDFDRAARLRHLRADLDAARSALPAGEADTPAFLSALGQWYRFQRSFDLASETFERARRAGAMVPHADMAQVLLGGGRRAEAAAEYELALRAGESPTTYLKQCLGASTQPAPSANPSPPHNN